EGTDGAPDCARADDREVGSHAAECTPPRLFARLRTDGAARPAPRSAPPGAQGRESKPWGGRLPPSAAPAHPEAAFRSRKSPCRCARGSGSCDASATRTGGRGWSGGDRFGGLLLGRIELAAVVVVLEQLGVAAPIDRRIELTAGLGRAEEVLERLEQAL